METVKTNRHFMFVFIFLSSLTSVLAGNILTRGSSLTAETTSKSNFLTSLDKTFTCGFYSFGENAYWFSIWYTNSNLKTVVWTANRDNPVNRHNSRLTLRKDGSMVLTDFDGSITWGTNKTGNVDKAELLNTGNFVIRGINGNYLWQSFDFPTDTLLPTQFITKKNSLVSSIGPKNIGSGYFNFLFDNDNVLKMLYNGPEITSLYWPDVDAPNVFADGRTNYNSSRIACFDKTGRFNSSDQMQFTTIDVGLGINRRLTLDYDGNLRVYSLNDSSETWVITWQAISSQCDVHGLCGRNGICEYNPEPRCSCPPNYEPTDSSDWRKGCKPKFNRNCSNSHFIELSHVDYYGYDFNYSSDPFSFEACKQLCSTNCDCLAFGYRILGEGICYIKIALFNGRRSVDFPGSIYLKVPNTAESLDDVVLNGSRPVCSNSEGKLVLLPGSYDVSNQRFKWVYPYSFVLAIGILEVIVFVSGWWFLFRKHGTSSSMEDGYRAISSQFRSFSYRELQKATGKFKEVLGLGGFGVVYKGVLSDDDRTIAVKKLGDVFQGEDEFWAEVSTIGRINHMNLARMWGFCSEGKHRLLVYEYVEGGPLDKHLFRDNGVLGWNERFKIALGTAKGLAYLHHECLEWVIHCDVKPENILLDKDFEPKISDFGLAKLCQRGGHSHRSSKLTGIRGTKGYMAPDWAMYLPITAKVDVYSYGVVILELVRGIRLSNWVVDSDVGSEIVSELVNFVRLAKGKTERDDDSWVGEFVDSRLERMFSRKQAALMIKVGFSCVEEDRNKRPTMESVAQVLAECEDETIIS
ncbi:putative receptor protein kinase ZmPK1 [Silene latifolia]|uniref:putative receptor protein kinase ZmPK1 n=1 Tax=Silene latifolia TaxID=37657 RepID=UPI003D7886F1